MNQMLGSELPTSIVEASSFVITEAGIIHPFVGIIPLWQCEYIILGQTGSIDGRVEVNIGAEFIESRGAAYLIYREGNAVFTLGELKIYGDMIVTKQGIFARVANPWMLEENSVTIEGPMILRFGDNHLVITDNVPERSVLPKYVFISTLQAFVGQVSIVATQSTAVQLRKLLDLFGIVENLLEENS